MAIINQRWPRGIAPTTQKFSRSRNDIIQESARTRVTTTIVQGRPLWAAECTWTMPNTDKLAKLRYWLEALQGYQGSVQLWDFFAPYPWMLNLGVNSGLGTSIFWANGSNPSAWNWAGFPSCWQLDSTVTVASNAAANATSVSVSGCDPSKIVCVQGQFVQVGRRLYIAANSVTADVSGNATITLLTGLISAATAGDTVRLVEAACEMRMLDQNWDQSAQAGQGMATVSAKFIETVQDFS